MHYTHILIHILIMLLFFVFYHFLCVVLRLLQRAPQPIPVLCLEPRAFPHVGNLSQISESSWTSDTTHSTDVTVGSRSLDNGMEEIHQIAAVSLGDDLSCEKPSATTAVTTNMVDECVGSLSRKVDVGIEIFERRVRVKRNNEGGSRKLSTCLSFPLEDSNGKLHVDRKNQLQRIKDETSCRGSRKTLSLSIHGDSEYWEKFRYSKDYQSSLMIETICNEVFNLKPSPRYKSLVKLSETDIPEDMSKDRKESKDGEIGSPPQLTGEVECNDSNDETGREMETTAEKEKGEDIKGVKSTSPLGIQSEREEKDGKGKVENVRSFLQKQHEQTEDSKVKDEERRNDERKSRNNSTTSSVYTTTTATTQDTSENDRRRRESLLLFDGFGQSFHGYLTKHETEKLLQDEGQYLIRQMVDEDGFILSLV